MNQTVLIGLGIIGFVLATRRTEAQAEGPKQDVTGPPEPANGTKTVGDLSDVRAKVPTSVQVVETLDGQSAAVITREEVPAGIIEIPLAGDIAPESFRPDEKENEVIFEPEDIAPESIPSIDIDTSEIKTAPGSLAELLGSEEVLEEARVAPAPALALTSVIDPDRRTVEAFEMTPDQQKVANSLLKGFQDGTCSGIVGVGPIDGKMIFIDCSTGKLKAIDAV